MGHLRWRLRFEMTGARSLATIYENAITSGLDAVSSRCSMLTLQRIERPIGTGDKANAALGSEEDAVGGRHRSCVHDRFRGIKDFHGLIDESAHEERIVRGWGGLEKNRHKKRRR
jgi:hypothetical protein